MGSRGISNGLCALSRAGVVAALVMRSGSAVEPPTLEKNTVTAGTQSGGGDGIRIDAPAASGANGGKAGQRNAISGSVNQNCRDIMSGTGNTGSANTWASDTATLQHIVNLCFSGAAIGVVD